VFARLVAFVCLGQFALCSRLPEPVLPVQPPLVVFLKGSEAQSPDAMRAMRLELQQLMANTRYQLEFRTSLDRSSVSGRLVVMEFKGVCGEEASPSVPLVDGVDLATTAVSDGHVLPFSQVNCPVISTLLAPGLASVQASRRSMLLGRSLGRIMAHELYHILADETRHVNVGVAKSSFSTADLLSADFVFEGTAIDRMSNQPVVVSGAGYTSDPDETTAEAR